MFEAKVGRLFEQKVVAGRPRANRHRDYRNPALAAAMKTLGHVNRFGRGITLVRVALEKNGNPHADFQVEDSYWSVTVRRNP